MWAEFVAVETDLEAAGLRNDPGQPPGNPEENGCDGIPRNPAIFGYLAGKVPGSPGYMRIMVAPDKVIAGVVRSVHLDLESTGRKNHEVAFSCTVPALTAAPARLKLHHRAFSIPLRWYWF